jgi:hypothetical protein
MQHAVYRIHIQSGNYLSASLNARLVGSSADQIMSGYILQNEDVLLDATKSGVYVDQVLDSA